MLRRSTRPQPSLVTFGLAALLLCVGCMRPPCPGCPPESAAAGAAGAVDPTQVLRVYSVPGGRAEDLRGVVSGLLRRKERPLGKASVGPAGQLIVVAPETIHAGVAELVAHAATLPPARAPRTLTMRYWLVAAQPGAAEGELDPALALVRPAIAELEAAQGPLRLRLLETLQMRSLLGQRGTLQGRLAELTQEASEHEGRLVADLDVHCKASTRLRTRIRIEPGQLLVLAQTGYREPGAWTDPASPPGPADVLFIVVRAELGPS